MKKWIGLVLVLLLAVSFGCAPTVIEGKKVDSAKLKEMNIGKTNKAQVEQMFGKPAKVEMVSAGVEKYIYTYRAMDPEWYTMDKTQNQAFEVWFKDGVLQYYKLRTEGREAVLKE
jgi:outer membrane protein assembly factor BamE (lipoprotein component of BamABCDE complex)